jgi:uncharacterized protein
MSETKQRRGFALMSPQRRKEIAARGGRESHIKGNPHEFNSEEARTAGRKGGLRTQEKRRAEKS